MVLPRLMRMAIPAAWLGDAACVAWFVGRGFEWW